MGLFGVNLEKELSPSDLHNIEFLLTSASKLPGPRGANAQRMLSRVQNGKSISRADCKEISKLLQALALSIIASGNAERMGAVALANDLVEKMESF